MTLNGLKVFPETALKFLIVDEYAIQLKQI